MTLVSRWHGRATLGALAVAVLVSGCGPAATDTAPTLPPPPQAQGSPVDGHERMLALLADLRDSAGEFPFVGDRKLRMLRARLDQARRMDSPVDAFHTWMQAGYEEVRGGDIAVGVERFKHAGWIARKYAVWFRTRTSGSAGT